MTEPTLSQIPGACRRIALYSPNTKRRLRAVEWERQRLRFYDRLLVLGVTVGGALWFLPDMVAAWPWLVAMMSR